MGLKKVTGAKVLDLAIDVRNTLNAPVITLYHPARAFFRTLALGLVGTTGITSTVQLEAVRQATVLLDETEETPWTALEAKRLLDAVGSIPAPTHVQVSKLPGEVTLLLRAVMPGAHKARKLNYYSRSGQAYITLLAALRPLGVSVPKGMAMVVPVKLVEDEAGIALAAFFGKGKLRDATEDEEGQAQPGTTPATPAATPAPPATAPAAKQTGKK